jgi:hypothetical protein
MNSGFEDDVSRWSREQLCEFLRENGIDEVKLRPF